MNHALVPMTAMQAKAAMDALNERADKWAKAADSAKRAHKPFSQIQGLWEVAVKCRDAAAVIAAACAIAGGAKEGDGPTAHAEAAQRFIWGA